MILKERVMDFIASQGSAVNIAMLEEEFGESRLRLGYILHLLLSENKISKSDRSYLAIN